MSDLVADLRLLTRRRQDAVTAEGKLTQLMKSIVSRHLGKPKVTTADMNAYKKSEALAPLFLSREPLREWRRREEKFMVAIVEQFPAYHSFWKPVRGLGALGLAQIIGEAGDLSNYPNPAKVWRRFGLHVVGGRALATWRSIPGGLSKEEWEAAGYSPRRRSTMHVITESLCKKKNEYKVLMDQRKTLEHAKAATEGLTVAPAAQIPKKSADRYRSLGHIQRRAMRYVGKRLLRNLWRAWRDAAALTAK